ncbi:thiol reductant ABC exporter subunit CydD [Dictyobacter alpinus]|uniref:Thiol reductant ABC exporter subunit CydD n=1 Tax=Dictyobacter alpinus TaxID=2014873 RepID=A0A402BF35_9CHLR|nr:thiol reductant ABC exporter subunit CydD [Dictyobacter alpinus]GCE29902.1 thiol reductant ABC exporter subunit CydD [Dictyobacter alpinus]
MSTIRKTKRKRVLNGLPRRRFLAGAAILDVLSTGVTIAQMMFLSQIVAAVFLLHKDFALVFPQLLLLLGTIILHAGCVWGRDVSVQYGAIRWKNAVRQRLFAHVLQLGPSYSKNEATGELVTVLYEGIERLDAYIGQYLPQLTTSILVPFLIAIFVFPLDWISGVLFLLTLPIIPLLMILIGSFAEQRTRQQWQALSRLSATLLDAIQGLGTLKLFGQSTSASKQIAFVSDSFRKKTLNMLGVAFLSGAVLEFMVAAAIGLIAVTLGVRLVNGGISFSNVFLILLLAPEFYRPLRELGVQHHAGMEGKVAMKRINEILAIPLPMDRKTFSPFVLSAPLTITFSDIAYTYPTSEQPVLDRINLTLSPGTCTALIGRSGEGKSTLVHLLMRFIKEQSGQISVNGCALSDLPVEMWRNSIALVPQRPSLFAGSVLDNLRLARPDASEAEILRACEQAGAAAFIEQLPQGYATWLGERGARLSAGQIQRLAIARAFLKDAPLLIMDESTSSLDPESETHIRQALERLTHNRTVLVIAHRQNTIACAQRVISLEAGTLIERETAERMVLPPYKVTPHVSDRAQRIEVSS